MRKYALFTGLLGIVLAAFTACYDVGGTTGLSETTETNAFIDSAFDDYEYHANANNEAVHTTSWQEAYAEKLSYYAQQPAATANIEATEWRFILHDINQHEIPQLFLVRYYDGLVSFHTAYSFEDGNAIRLKSSLCVGSLLSGGMYIAPGGTGVIRYFSTGIVNHYDKFELFGTTLSRTVNGDTVPTVDSFRINAFPVTEEEFEYMFGCYDEKVLLVLHEITEANIRNIIFEW